MSTATESGGNWFLRDRNTQLYMAGGFISTTGSRLQASVQAFLVVSLATRADASTWTGVIWAFGLVPCAIFAPFTGTLLDRWNKRAVLIGSAVVGVLQALTFVYLTYAEHIALWHICLLALITGLMASIDRPGNSALLRDVVTRSEDIKQATKLTTLSYNISQTVGPGLAGYLIVKFGYPATFLLNALSFVVLICALLSIRIKTDEKKETGSPWEMLQSGASYTFGDPGVRLCVLLTSIVTFFGYSYVLLLAVINQNLLDGTAISYGYLAGSTGAGSLLGALLTLVLDKKVSNKASLIVGLFLNGISLVCLSSTTDLHVAVAAVFFAGVGNIMAFSSLRSSLQLITKKEAIGAVFGYYFSLYFAGMVACACIFGPLGDYVGLPIVLLVSGAALLILTVWVPRMSGIAALESK